VKVTTKQVVLSDFSGGMSGITSQRLLPLRYANVSYNFNTCNGALTDGVGLDFLSFPATKKSVILDQCILGLYYFKRFVEGTYKDLILLYCQDKFIYKYDVSNNQLNRIEELFFETKPIGISYKFNQTDVFIFSTEKEGLFVFDGESALKVENVPVITSMCIHNERLFVTTNGEKTRLYFSDDFNPFNFNVSLDEGGYIDFQDQRGGLNKVVSNLGYLYIFRSYGISRLSSFYAQENFSVSHLFTCVGKIYPQSVTICDSGIIFLASDGLYMLTESSVKKILPNYDNFFYGVDNSDSKGEYFNGNFYLKCKMKFSQKVEDVLVVYSVNDNNGYVSKNLNIFDLCPILSEEFSCMSAIAGNCTQIFAFCNGASICTIPLTKVWETPITDLGIIGKDKVLKKIELYTKTDVTVKVETDKMKKTFLLKPKGTYAMEKVNVRGSEFKFIISCNVSGSEIAKPTLTFSYV